MATTKLYLDTRAVSDDKPAPLKITITKRGKSAMLGLNIKLLPSEWDAVKCKVINHPQRIALNTHIAKMLLHVNTMLYDMEEAGELAGMTATEIKNVIFRKIHARGTEDDARVNLLTRLHLRSQKARKPRTREIYTATAVSIKKFSKKADKLKLTDITADWLAEYDMWLAQNGSPGRNARNIHLRNLRAIFNEAIDDGVTTHYPFRKFKIKPEPTTKRAYDADRLRQIFNYPCEDYQQKYVDIFKLVFLLIGINASDLWGARPLTNDRLVYTRNKTGRQYDIKVEPEAMEIINRYAGKKKLLALAEKANSAHYFNMILNRGLQQLGGSHREYKMDRGKMRWVLVHDPAFPHLTTYVARHSWATIAAELDIPKDTIAAALGHGGNTVTDIYINYDRKKVDEANRRVIDYVLHDKR